MKTSYPIEYHAMCRECSKEFGANPLTVDQMNKAMNEHVKNNIGHIIVGIETRRMIIKKRRLCIAS